MSITRVRVVILFVQSERGRQWRLCVRTSLIWNGVVNCACVLCNKMAYYIYSILKYTLKKWHLGEVLFFENCDIVHCGRADLYVNEDQVSS